MTHREEPATAAAEVGAGARYGFGRNWKRFLAVVDERRIAEAELSLLERLGLADLAGLRFLDVGCGSGLFSLAAVRLGAQVHSFDYDDQSVACACELRRRFACDSIAWQIEQGSALDTTYLARLDRFDVVYSWGVLHHTGDMWQALENMVPLVKPRGRLFVALYNDQGAISRLWTRVKRLYNRHAALRPCFIAAYAPVVAAYVAWRRLSGQTTIERGMSHFVNMLDWLGGYPFEVATPEAVFRFYRDRGFDLADLSTRGGRQGCNEFVLMKRD